MSVRVLAVGDEQHRRQSQQVHGERMTFCSCGQFASLADGASRQASSWRAHVKAIADERGEDVTEVEVDKVAERDVQKRPIVCGACHWQGLRPTPDAKYRGPTGPCPKCGGGTSAVGTPRNAGTRPTPEGMRRDILLPVPTAGVGH